MYLRDRIVAFALGLYVGISHSTVDAVVTRMPNKAFDAYFDWTHDHIVKPLADYLYRRGYEVCVGPWHSCAWKVVLNPSYEQWLVALDNAHECRFQGDTMICACGWRQEDCPPEPDDDESDYVWQLMQQARWAPAKAHFDEVVANAKASR